ncbi:MAG: helix-turn-helix domain-containing protein [Planctomycetaceae bacterium]|nr:helix-turn-helix domain-containing protein [Planctomycetaceae bacterium]
MLNCKEIVGRLFLLYDVSTQTALSEKLGITQTLISRWIKDPTRRPSWDTMEKVIEETGVTWDWLLEGREPQYRDQI